MIVSGIGSKEIGVCLFYGIEFIDIPLVGKLVVYHHDGGCTVFVQLVKFFGRKYSSLIYFGKYPFYMADVIGRRQDVAQVHLIIVFQFFERLFLRTFIQLKIGLERSQDAVLLSFYYLVVFVDREIESGHQLSVLPGFVNIKLVIELAVPWQEVHDNSDGTYENKCPVYQISER